MPEAVKLFYHSSTVFSTAEIIKAIALFEFETYSPEVIVILSEIIFYIHVDTTFLLASAVGRNEDASTEKFKCLEFVFHF